jgi:hypothetical protein
MDGKTHTCLKSSLRIWGLLLLVLIFTMQAQASFPVKSKTDITPALFTAEQDLRDAVRKYNNEVQLRIAREDAEAYQNMIPSWSLIAANRGK